MTDSATEPLPPLKAAERHVRLAVDTFCVECGYNLHSQEVTRDERLGIFICRCPECGRFHPAGLGFTATRPWLARLATMMLILWVLIVLFALVWICVGMGAIEVGYIDDSTYGKNVSMDGREVEWFSNASGGSQLVIKGTTQPVVQSRYVRVMRERSDHREQWILISYVIGAVLLGWATGMLMVSFLWHWKRWRYGLAMLLPMAIAAVVCSIFNLQEEYAEIQAWVRRAVLGIAALETASMGGGILLGRPIVRTTLRMFVPPKPRQHFAFLWGVDGKRMTPANP